MDTDGPNLRISKPADEGKFKLTDGIGAGIKSNFTIDGDFDVTVDFALHDFPYPAGPHQFNKSFLEIVPASGVTVSVLRLTLNQRDWIEVFASFPEARYKLRPSNLPKGRYRISRQGATTTGSFAPAGSSVFTALKSYEGISGPVHIKLAGAQGPNYVGGPRPTTSLDITFDNLIVHADRIERAPATDSQKPKRNWGPEQATGAPDTLRAGDIPTAWASLTRDGRPEWLLLDYAKPIKATAVLVYESFNPRALSKISVFDPDGKEVEIWHWMSIGKTPIGIGGGYFGGSREVSNGVAICKFPVKVDFKVKRVKLYLDSPRVKGWNEIDAVGLADEKGKTHWAIKAEASSTYARGWGPEQATGAPDTPRAGDIPTAWASLTPDGQAEWLLLEYEPPIKPKAIHVYETFNPGALSKVTFFGPDRNEVEVWKGKDPSDPGIGMGVSNIPVDQAKVTFPVRRVKLYLDSPRIRGWNEIDAVGLVDQSGKLHWATKAEASSTYAARGSQDAEPALDRPASIPSTGKALKPNDTIRPGDVLQAEWQEQWWAARVVAVQPDGRVKVHYIGWEDSWDEVVPRSRLQHDGDAAAKARASKSAASRSTPPEVKIPKRAVTLSHVADSSTDKRSLGGSGHAVRFERPDDKKHVFAVQIYASRYGYPQAPNEDFHVYLLDQEMKVIKDYVCPYGAIERTGQMRWYTLKLPPTEAPRQFHVALSFNPHRTKGIYLGVDKGVEQSHSYVGVPGDAFEPVGEAYDWMVRALLTADPDSAKELTGGVAAAPATPPKPEPNNGIHAASQSDQGQKEDTAPLAD